MRIAAKRIGPWAATAVGVPIRSSRYKATQTPIDTRD